MPGRFEQLDPIAVRLFDLDLFAARADLDVVSETQTRLFQLSDARRQVLHLQENAVGSAGLLQTAVGQSAGSGRSRTAQDQLEAANRHLPERRRVLHIQSETERLRIKPDRPLNIC